MKKLLKKWYREAAIKNFQSSDAVLWSHLYDDEVMATSKRINKDGDKIFKCEMMYCHNTFEINFTEFTKNFGSEKVVVEKKRENIGWNFEHFTDIYVIKFDRKLINFLSENDKKEATRNIYMINKIIEIDQYKNMIDKDDKFVEFNHHIVINKSNNKELIFVTPGITHKVLERIKTF